MNKIVEKIFNKIVEMNIESISGFKYIKNNSVNKSRFSFDSCKSIGCTSIKGPEFDIDLKVEQDIVILNPFFDVEKLIKNTIRYLLSNMNYELESNKKYLFDSRIGIIYEISDSKLDNISIFYSPISDSYTEVAYAESEDEIENAESVVFSKDKDDIKIEYIAD